MAGRNGHRPRRTRLNMRIPSDLLEWAKDYAAGKNKSLTQLVVDHLTKLKEKTDAGTDTKAA
jgi:predicted HicB family RNase H-like nuclease